MSMFFDWQINAKLNEIEASNDNYDKFSVIKELRQWVKTHRQGCRGYHDVEEFYQD